MAGLIFIDGGRADFERALDGFIGALEDRVARYNAIMREAQATAITDADLRLRLGRLIDATETIFTETLEDLKSPLPGLFAEKHFGEAGARGGHHNN